MVFVGGSQGSGKSWAACELARCVDPTFGIHRVAFNAKNFRKTLEGLKRGQAVIMDEAGADLYKREWYKKEHMKINKMLMTVRFQNNLIIMTAPTFGSVDEGVRKNFNFFIRMIDVDRERQLSYGKLYLIWINHFTGKMGYKRVWTMESDLGGGLVNHLLFPRPPKEMTTVYEKKAEKFKRWILSDEYYKRPETIREKREERGKKLKRFDPTDENIIMVKKQVLENPQKFIRFDNVRTDAPFRMPPESIVHDLKLPEGVKISQSSAKYVISKLMDDHDFKETIKKEKPKLI